jgi:anaphase-promoting complex subunit 1
MTEMALSQIGKKPFTDKCLDREGYSLAAGWALGMICLGMKGTKENFRDLQLEERLIRFIEGGRVM